MWRSQLWRMPWNLCTVAQTCPWCRWCWWCVSSFPAFWMWSHCSFPGCIWSYCQVCLRILRIKILSSPMPSCYHLIIWSCLPTYSWTILLMYMSTIEVSVAQRYPPFPLFKATSLLNSRLSAYWNGPWFRFYWSQSFSCSASDNPPGFQFGHE